MRNKANNVPRVTVLTHCDTTVGSSAAAGVQARLNCTVKKAMEYGSMVCAIGKYTSLYQNGTTAKARDYF